MAPPRAGTGARPHLGERRRAAGSSAGAWAPQGPIAAPAGPARRDRSDGPRSPPCAGRCTRGRRRGPGTRRRSESRARTRRNRRGQNRGRGCHHRGSGETHAPPIPAPTTRHRDRRGIGRARSRRVAGRSDRARSGSDGAADTAPLRCPRPCARPPSPPPRPRVAALGIRVGSTRCRPPLTTGTRPRG